MARNRYGWQKRAKEMARKEKNDEKMKRRQGKAMAPPAEEELPEVMMELSLDETDPVGVSLQQGS
ncbi:MAG: hypothetical protein NTW80_02045 [Deltaproteobacteria bacterium]|nr:hypothetical protein [Deltaproteobacteria bacterium]